jgi:hypothetical protein
VGEKAVMKRENSEIVWLTLNYFYSTNPVESKPGFFFLTYGSLLWGRHGREGSYEARENSVYQKGSSRKNILSDFLINGVAGRVFN